MGLDYEMNSDTRVGTETTDSQKNSALNALISATLGLIQAVDDLKDRVDALESAAGGDDDEGGGG